MLALLLAVGLLPHGPVMVDRCELAEFNVTASACQDHVDIYVAQLVFWDGVIERGEFVWRVRDWRRFDYKRLEGGKLAVQWPHFTPRGLGGVFMWHDKGVLRVVHVKQVRYSLTTRDPELADRKFLDEDMRSRLKCPPRPEQEPH